MRRFLYVCAAFLLTTPLAAAELAGANMSDSIRVGDHSLVLNGQGLRKKAIFKVYVGGLYLKQKENDPQKILAADEPRKMVLHFVRNVGKDSIAEAWTDCLASNNSGASADLEQQFGRLGGWMDNVSDGDRLAFTYTPGTGTQVEVKNKAQGTIAGKEFADALFACWIGSTPPSEDFKEGLLGG